MTELVAFAALRQQGCPSSERQLLTLHASCDTRRPAARRAHFASLSKGITDAKAEPRGRQGEPSTSGAGADGKLTLLPAWEVVRGGIRGRQYAWDGKAIRLVDEDEARGAPARGQGTADETCNGL